MKTFQRITGVTFAVELGGKPYVAAWTSPYSVNLHDRETREVVASYKREQGSGRFTFAEIAAASDASNRFSLAGY